MTKSGNFFFTEPHSPFRPHPPLPRVQDSRTGRANRTRSGPAPSFAQGGAGRYAPHLLPHSRENRTREWKAQGPRLLVCAGGAERYAPPPSAPLTRQQDAQTERAAPPLSPAALDCAQKGAQRFPPPRSHPTPTHTRTRRANEHAGIPPPVGAPLFATCTGGCSPFRAPALCTQTGSVRRGGVGGAGVKGTGGGGMGHVRLESGRLEIRTGKLSFIWLCIEPSTAGIRGAIMGSSLAIYCKTIMKKSICT